MIQVNEVFSFVSSLGIFLSRDSLVVFGQFSWRKLLKGGSVRVILSMVTARSEAGIFEGSKILSREMDPAEIKLIKEWGAEIFGKIRRSPMLWKPFKVTASSRTAVGNS
jgi:hypothetical protein